MSRRLPALAVLGLISLTALLYAPTLDDDKYKNFGLHLSGDVGPVSLGAYGFVGTELGDALVKNETVILGPQVGFSMRDLVDVSVVWLERRDSSFA